MGRKDSKLPWITLGQNTSVSLSVPLCKVDGFFFEPDIEGVWKKVGSRRLLVGERLGFPGSEGKIHKCETPTPRPQINVVIKRLSPRSWVRFRFCKKLETRVLVSRGFITPRPSSLPVQETSDGRCRVRQSVLRFRIRNSRRLIQVETRGHDEGKVSEAVA